MEPKKKIFLKVGESLASQFAKLAANRLELTSLKLKKTWESE